MRVELIIVNDLLIFLLHVATVFIDGLAMLGSRQVGNCRLRASKSNFSISLPPYGKRNQLFGKPSMKSDMVDFTILTKCWENVRKNGTSPPVLGI